MDIIGMLDQSHCSTLRYANTFRFASRARSVHHVEHVLWLHQVRKIGGRLRLELFNDLLPTQKLSLILPELFALLPPSEHKSDLSILHHELESFCGMSRVQRDISPSCFEHAQNADQHLQTAFHQDRDQLLWSDPLLAQGMRQSIGLLI